MSLAKTFLKHRFIIEQLRRRPQKLIELNATWKDSEDNVEGGDLLQRTLQRDIQVIREVYNIEIKCNRSTNEYEITEDNDLYAQNLLEAFDVFRALQNYGNLLKEAQRRWYVLAWDVEKEALRVFGLDRIKRLDDERGVKFQHPVPKDVEHYFDDSFGAWVDNERTQAEEVVLAFRKLPTDTVFIPNPAKYLEAMPLHSSQQILKEEEEAIVLRLRIKITPDFIKELLSYGKQVEVLTPAHLQEELIAKQK